MSRRIHSPKIYIECEVKDKDGKLIDKRKFRGMSWVGNIVGFLCCLFKMWHTVTYGYYSTGMSPSFINDVGGTARGISLGNASGNYGMILGGQAPAGETTAGIVVGSSDTPVSIDDYKLVSQIAHGTGVGQLQYGATTTEDIFKTSNSWTFRIVRTFTNGSGATVTVKEIGLYVRLGMPTSPHYYTAMFSRDVLTTPINVPNGATLTVRYIITHTV